MVAEAHQAGCNPITRLVVAEELEPLTPRTPQINLLLTLRLWVVLVVEPVEDSKQELLLVA
jgi:hypothetical protein